MSRYTYLILIPPVLLFIILSTFLTQQLTIEQQSLRAWQLGRVANLCVDAATAEMLETGDVNITTSVNNAGTELIHPQRTVDPSKVLDTLAEVYCINYGLPVTESNKQSVLLDYVDTLVVAVYDGIHFLDNGKLMLKMPYVNMSNSSYSNVFWRLDTELGTRVTATSTTYSVTEGVTSASRKVDIIDTINRGLVRSYMRNHGYSDTESKLPEGVINTIVYEFEDSVKKTSNTISNPTVICSMTDRYGSGSTLAVGGTQIKDRDRVVCYRRDTSLGTKNFYTFSSRLKAAGDDYAGAKTFDTPLEAAQAGYNFDLSYK